MEECGTGGASMGILSVGTDTFYYGMGRLAGTNDTDPGAGTGAALADVEAAGKSADKGSGMKTVLLLAGVTTVITLCTACGQQQLETQSLVESLAIDEGQEISFVFAVAEGEGDSAEKSELEQESGTEDDNNRIFATKADSIHEAMDIYGDYHQKKLNLNHLQYLYMAESMLQSEQLGTILEELQLDEQFSRGILLYVTEGTPVHELLNAWYNQQFCELPLVTEDHRYKDTIRWQYSDQ